LAYLQVALYESWQLPSFKISPNSDQSAAWILGQELSAHRAAYGVLEQLYPNETLGAFASRFVLKRDQATSAHNASGSSTPQTEFVNECMAHGARIAEILIQRSLRDGAGRTWPLARRPTAFTGIWQPSYSLYGVNPLEAFAGTWQPWATISRDRYQPPTAARPGSQLHAQETQEVWNTARSLDAQQKEAAQFWHLESGSVTPAGIWTRLAWDAALEQLTQTAHQQEASIQHITGLLAAMRSTSAAIHDAFIACWRIKYRDWSERPITAVRKQINAEFVPLLVTPGFPSYVSGHATISAAASRVLGSWLPQRTAHFERLAQEAAMSRLWGGIHFRSDNDEGLMLGRSVA
jgi:hypothetical protein